MLPCFRTQMQNMRLSLKTFTKLRWIHGAGKPSIPSPRWLSDCPQLGLTEAGS